MPIHFSCACGKRLRVPDELEGRRVRCHSCGQVSAVPARPKEPLTAPESIRPRDTAEDGSEEEPNLSGAPPRTRRKKKKKTKERYRSQWGGVDIFGVQLTLRNGIGATCVLLLVAGIIYIMVPSYHCKIVEARRVDVYAALEVANRNIGKEALGMQSSKVLNPGGEKFVIVRDSPEGEAVLVHLKLPPKFLAAHAYAHQGTLLIRSQEFLLQGDGQPVEGLILDRERGFTDPAKGATMDFSTAVNGDPLLPRDRPPWNPQGKTIKEYRAEAVNVKGELMDSSVFVCTGKARFQGKNGMEVKYDYEGTSVVVTWDSQSRGYVGNTQQDFIDRFLLESLELICVFPRPSGKQLTLTVLGEKVGTINPK